ncbi:hypothetical protein J6590_046451 [Homalodisca vitripennis]|nr:hypothetical protein J6590_046451 [Homalodisca vitripennis]
MAQADLAHLEEQNAVWRYDPCGQARRKSMRLETSAQEGKITLEDIIKALSEIRDEQRNNYSRRNCGEMQGIPEANNESVVQIVKDKELLINKRREKRQEFTTRHIGLAVNKPIFVNESLSPARKQLLGQARELRGGNIFMRVSAASPAIEIKSAADLEKL